MKPNYKKIFTDIILEKFPEKMNDVNIKNKIENINSAIDVLTLNRLIFGENPREDECKNQKLHSYDEDSIVEILNYQKKNNLNNSELASHFKLSKNTVTKWRALFN